MPLAIAICDDEINICGHIERLIKKHSEDCHADIFISGESLLTAQREYDIYFIDIKMPGINGMETAEKIRERQRTKSSGEGLIIFITALKEYMANAFDVKAFHYLVKPVDESKFAAVFLRAVNDCKRDKENADKYIIIKSGNTRHTVCINEIFYVESRNNKVVVNGVTGIYEYYTALQEIETTLGNGFFRCHRCYLVNMAHIKRYTSNAIWLINGDEIHMAQKKYPLFVKAYMTFIKNEGSARG
jgi:DNA-binding LytR/AlgR family response regulator